MLRTARVAVTPSITLDFLIPARYLHRSLVRPASTEHASSFVPGNSSTASTRPAHPETSSSPAPRPGAVLAKLDEKLQVFATQPLSTLTNDQAQAINTVIAKLRGAFMRQDVLKAWDIWTKLKQDGLLVFLGPPHYDLCSRSIATLCENSPRQSAWSGQRLHAAEEISVAAAAGGFTDGLTSIMLQRLKLGEVDAALALYTRYHSLDAQKRADETDDVDTSVEDEDDLTFASVHADPLMAAIAAHALRSTFTDALHMRLNAFTRLHRDQIATFRSRLSFNPTLQESFDSFVSRLETARVVSRPSTFTKHLANMTESKYSRGLEGLYRNIIAGLEGNDAWLVLNSSELSHTRPVLLPSTFWDSFLSSFLTCSRVDMAEIVWDDMQRLGIEPALSTWNTLLEGYAKIRHVEDTCRAWDLMLSQGIKPDALSYRALIQALQAAGRTAESIKRFQAFEGDLLRRSNALNDETVLLVYQAMHHGLLLNDMESEADALFEKMQRVGPKPSIGVFNSLLGHQARKRDFKALAHTLQRLEPAGVTADVYTFSIILSALLPVRPDAAQFMLKFMKKHGVQPNSVTMTSIIRHQLQQNSEDGLKAALELLTRMEQGDIPDAPPNLITYTTILNGIHRQKWMERTVAEKLTVRVWDAMRARKIRPEAPIYNVLIKASLDDPRHEGVERALQLYREMAKERVYVPRDTWYLLLRGLGEREEWTAADYVRRQLLRTNQPLSAPLVKWVNKAAMHAARKKRLDTYI